LLWTCFRKQETKGITSGGALRHSAEVRCLLGQRFFGNRNFTDPAGQFPFSEVLCAAAGCRQVQGVALVLNTDVKLGPARAGGALK